MRLRIHYRSFPASLMFNVLVLLLHPVSTQRNRNQIYFLDQGKDIVLKGPDNPGKGPLAWEWKPHSGQHTHQLGTFTRSYSGSWSEYWNSDWKRSDFYQEVQLDYYTVDLRIKRPKFKFAGLFTLTQTQPTKQILRHYEIFGIKVEVSPQWPVEGSDVTLSCTISRLPDTVSLHWKPVGSSQQNRRNTDQIRLNNTVYLMVQHVTVEDGKLYQCEVRESGNVVGTSKADFTVYTNLYRDHYTLYRPSTGYSELHLLCYSRIAYARGMWTWSSHQPHSHQKQIASATKHQPINVSGTDFGNRLVASVEQFNGMNLNVRIAPVLFGDAGVYTCSLESTAFLTIELITVKVTAEPSDTVTEGDTVTLNCSVSDITASTRLVWINGDGETVGAKRLNGDEKSVSLIILKAERGRGKWTCGVFDQDMLRILVPYYQELSGSVNSIYFLHQEGIFVLKGPDNPGSGSIDLEWRSHSGQQTTKRLATFHREDQRWAVQWSDEYSKIPDISQRLHVDWGTLNLKIREPTFELAGEFTWTQTRSGGKTLRQWEISGIKVEADSQRPAMGSDVTLSCTISRLPDTINLHWKPVGSSQQNRRNTDQIRLNNTVYLMLRHVTVEDGKLYQCEVRENGSIVGTSKAAFTVNTYLYGGRYTLYRPSTDYSELQLLCYSRSAYDRGMWTWSSRQPHSHQKQIASATEHQPINVSSTDFGNRLVASVEQFNGMNLNVRIAPVLFGDAGVYTCCLGSTTFLTIKLITMKVTAEPSDTVTEGDNVTLRCSVSDVTASTRLVWINEVGEIVREKTLTEEEKSLSLIVQKAERGRVKWTCGVLDLNRLRILIPYYQELSGSVNSIYFLHQEGIFVLKGPDNPGRDSIDLEWSPYTGQQTTKRLATFHREEQRWTVQWSDEYNKIPDISQRLHVDWGTLNLKIREPPFELAGQFTWTQTQSGGKILRQWEVFGIKVEADSQRPVIGSDVILSCTISRLPDTVSLHWKPRGSSQRSNNTDQIRLNNTVYLMVRHIGTGDPSLYIWEVQENGSIVLTGDNEVGVDEVTAEPPDAVTEGDNVTLTCSVSKVSESMRLVWINSDGETVDEKIFMEQKRKGDTLQLIIPTDDKVQIKWTCVLLHQNIPKIFIPYYLQVNKDRSFKHTTVVIIGGLALLLIIILVMVLCLRKCKVTGLRNQREKSRRTERNTEDDSNLYANPNEMQPIQGTNEMPEPETSHIAEYMSVSRKATQGDTEENIHYGSICFKKNAPGERHAGPTSNQVSDTNLPSSNQNTSSVIYAPIATKPT
ncbi:uncharacterized protein [Hemitrygon akajei]|uniref:uncharacterized protein isoform X2 n=1 Tax=Hemitrygon akajei TaxID=2704970 RepID=UPI003BF977C8